MRKFIWILPFVILIVIILVFLAGRFFYYNSTVASAYTPPERGMATVELAKSPKSARLEAVDNPQVSRGVVVIDYAHDNALYVEELNVLLSKIAARGFSYELVQDADAKNSPSSAASDQSANTSDQLAPMPTSPQETSPNLLTDKLRYAAGLILPLPRRAYTPDEVDQIKQFVAKGGRVLIIGDPTRTTTVDALNSIASEFDLIYANDYLYSLNHNDNNYRNVVYTNFKKSPLTTGLDEKSKVIFYANSSVYSPGHEIIIGDDTTHSSLSEGGRVNSPAALTTQDRVLALGDLTFLTEPYSNAENNGVLINNIAAFLSSGRRDLTLADFPYFFNPNVDIVFGSSLVFNSQLADSVKLKEELEKVGRVVTFTDKIDSQNDVIFIGRFNETDVITDYLAAGHISIVGPDEKTAKEPTPLAPVADTTTNQVSDQPNPNKEDRFVEGRIRLEGVGDLERGGATLFYLYRQPHRNVLIILSDDVDTNADAFNTLFNHDLAACQVSPTLAVCQTQTPGNQLGPSLRKTRIHKILVVADDSGRARADVQTGALDFERVLSATYKVDTLTLSLEDAPTIDRLLEYDAVIWTTGDYWDDSINADNTTLLTNYVEMGGNLILSGASIAFDWDHTDFLTSVLHAQYKGFAPQIDMEPALPDHAIAADFKAGEVITFTASLSLEPLNIDVVDPTADARAIFKRGAASEQAGAASIIAYEDKRVKIAYYAFPIYLLPANAQNRLINNTVNWFTKKPLEPPSPAETPTPVETPAPAPAETPTPAPSGG